VVPFLEERFFNLSIFILPVVDNYKHISIDSVGFCEEYCCPMHTPGDIGSPSPTILMARFAQKNLSDAPEHYLKEANITIRCPY
jgi:hypothetical protein